MRIPLLSGAMATRSRIANAQRSINLYGEINAKDAPVPLTFYQRQGMRPLVQGIYAPVRGIYRTSNGLGYCVIGQNFYQVTSNNGAWSLTLLGELQVAANNPVSMIDNGITLWLVDGSNIGYTCPLGGQAFEPIVDPTGAFTGATKVDYIDTFGLWNIPGTNEFGSTLSNEISFDPLYIAGKTDYPDPIATLIVNRHEILLLGELKSEIWFDAGNALFPFAELPGAYIEHGCVAPYSAASTDISVFWLGQDLQGSGMVYRFRGYQTTVISNHALTYAIDQMQAQGAIISDAIGYTYQRGGHVFYVLCFPSGNQTWVFDDSISDPNMAWNQRAYTDSQGNLNRDRSNCCANLFGTNVVGDWQNGTLYALDWNYYFDGLPGGLISFIRGFPHLKEAMNAQGQIIPIDLQRTIQVNAIWADLECGDVPLDANGAPAQIQACWSVDRGKTFGNAVMQRAGAPGEYRTQPQWQGVQTISRDFVLEFRHSIAGPAALNGAWYSAVVLEK